MMANFDKLRAELWYSGCWDSNDTYYLALNLAQRTTCDTRKKWQIWRLGRYAVDLQRYSRAPCGFIGWSDNSNDFINYRPWSSSEPHLGPTPLPIKKGAYFNALGSPPSFFEDLYL